MGFIWLLFLPIWPIAASCFLLSFLWLCTAACVSNTVHSILNLLTAGSFERNLETLMVPDKNEPKGIARMVAKALLNDLENYTYFAPVVWNSFWYSTMWIGVIYMRMNGIGGLWLPILLHLYVFGTCAVLGGNEIHYVAHLQVSTRNEAHLFKYEILNLAVRYLLEPAMGWTPGFWLDHHVNIHHKESNGIDDIQTISFFERNPVNFVWYIAELPIQWYVRGPHHHYLQGEKIRAVKMVISEVMYLAIGVALYLWDPLTSVLLVWGNHLTRLSFFNALNEYTQHALVDNRHGNPESPSNNSFLLLQDSPSSFFFPVGLKKKSPNWEDQWHAVHHIYPRKHMGDLRSDCQKVKCKLVFDITYAKYRNAVIFKDIKTLAAAWRPGYQFDADGNEDKPDPNAKPTGDAALDMAGREKLIASFFKPAFSHESCGPALKIPPFPFMCMNPGVPAA